MVVQAGVEAYKHSKDYKDQRIAFSTLAYLEGKDEVQKKIVAHFLDLDFAFLDEDSEAEEGPALEAKGAADLPKLTPAPSA